MTGILFLAADCKKFYAHCAYDDEIEEELEDDYNQEIEQLKKDAQQNALTFATPPQRSFPVTIAKDNEINNYI